MRKIQKPKKAKKDKKTTDAAKATNKKLAILKKVLKITFATIFFFILVSGVVIAAVGFGMIKTAPPLDIDKILSLSEPAIFYDDKGNEMDVYLTDKKREKVSINQIPTHLKDAVVSIEDERFYEHEGIDWYRFMGAQKANVKSVINKIMGKPYQAIQGASTIPQQLIKNRLFKQSSLEDRINFERKIQEMYLANELVKELSKDKILEAYLNTVLMGSNAYGIDAAAEKYFSKDLQDLDLLECAFLASTVQLPSLSYSNAKAAFDKGELFYSPRTLAVLNKMLELGKITQEEFDGVVNNNLGKNGGKDGVGVKINISENNNKMNYEWFSRTVIEQVRRDFQKQGKTMDEINALLSTEGVKIYTTMDKQWQDNTQIILDDNLTEEKTKASDYLFPRNKDLTPVQEKLQASTVVMDYRTGEVKVIIGGRGPQGPLSFNRAASMDFLKPPGSTIKPLTVYGPAIDTKKLTAGTVIEDSPLNEEQRKKYNVGNATSGGKILQYPRNAPNRYSGYLNLRYGLKESKNTVAMKIVDQIGLETSYDYGKSFGLALNSVDRSSLASLALGELTGGNDGTSGANPLMLATAYGAFGNGGIVTDPVVYTKVVSRTGEILLESEASTRRVLSEDSSYIMYDLLKEPVTTPYVGTGTRANMENMDTRGKTGTSGDKKNLWFTGFTPYYSCSVWVGLDIPEKIKTSGTSFGSNSVAGIWKAIMTPIHEGLENKEAVQMPSSIKKVEISKDSGTLPSDLTRLDPRGNRVYEEIFLPGTVPTRVDNVHELVDVVTIEGKDYLAREQTISGEIKQHTLIQKVYIKRDELPFTGPDRESYTVEDQKYVAPTELEKYDDGLDSFFDNFDSPKDDEAPDEFSKEIRNSGPFDGFKKSPGDVTDPPYSPPVSNE